MPDEDPNVYGGTDSPADQAWRDYWNKKGPRPGTNAGGGPGGVSTAESSQRQTNMAGPSLPGGEQNRLIAEYQRVRNMSTFVPSAQDEYHSLENAYTRRLGYIPTFWQDPQRVAKYHAAIKAAPKGWTPPPWMNVDQLNQAYEWFKFRNKNAPEAEWKWLPASDPANPFLAAMESPPMDFLSPRDSRYANPREVSELIKKTPEFDWYALPNEQRHSILRAQDFDLTQYPREIQDQMRADENFDWSRVPGWQEPVFNAMSSPVGMGIVSSLPMATAVGIGGAVAGGPLGFLAGFLPMIGFGAAAGFISSNEEIAKYAPGVSGAAAKFLEAMNWPAQTVTQGIGAMGQLAYTDWGKFFDDTKPLSWNAARLKRYVDAAYQAGYISYAGNPMMPALLNLIPVMEVIGTEFAEHGLQVRPSVMASVWMNAVKDGRVAAPGQVWILGAAKPVTPELNVIKAMDNARQRILAGDNPVDVQLDAIAAYGVTGIERNLIGQIIADPLNAMPAVERMGMATIGAVTGSRLLEYAAMAPKAERAHTGGLRGWALNMIQLEGVTDTIATLKAMTRNNMVDVKNLTRLEKWMAGLDDAGRIKEMQKVTATGIKGSVQRFFGLQEEAKAILGQGYMKENVSAFLLMFGDDVDAAYRYLHAISKGDYETLQELNTRLVGSPEWYTFEAGLRGMDDKLDTLQATWAVGEIHRGNLLRVAEVLGVEPGRVLEDLIARKGSLAAAMDDIRAKANLADTPARQAMKADLDSGTFKVEDLLALVEIFEDGSIPWHPGQFLASTVGMMEDHFGKWAVEYYGVKPDSPVMQLAHIMKRGQSLVLLGFNPSRLLGDAMSNIVHRIAVGAYGYMTPGQINQYFKRFGIEPARMHEGIGAFNDPNLQVGVGPMIRDVKWRSGMMRRAYDFMGRINKVGIFNVMAGKMEGMESTNTFAIDIKRTFSWLWQRDRGFRPMPADLAGRLTPDQIEMVYRAIEGGLNMDEITQSLRAREWGFTARSLIARAAELAGVQQAMAASMLSQLGVLDELDAGLAAAGPYATEAQVDAVFTRAINKANNAVDQLAGMRVRTRAEQVRNKTTTEGPPAVVDMVIDIEGAYTQRWMEHYDTAGDVMAGLDDIEDPKVRHHMVEEWYRQTGKEWDRTNLFRRTMYAGMIDGLGLLGIDATEFQKALGKQDLIWDQAYNYRKEQTQAYWNDYKDNWDDLARPTQRQAMQDRIRQKFQDAYEASRKQQLKISKALEKMIRASLGDQAAAAARAAMEDVANLRDDMWQREMKFRDSLESMSYKDRRAAWARFKEETIGPMIMELQRVKEEGVKAIQRAAQGLPPEEPAPAGPPRGEPPVPAPAGPPEGGQAWDIRKPQPGIQVATAQVDKTLVQQYMDAGMTRSEAIDRAADDMKQQQQAELLTGQMARQVEAEAKEASKVDKLVEIAGYKGIATATKDGRPTDRHLLNVLNKHRAGDAEPFTRENLPDRAEEATGIIKSYQPGTKVAPKIITSAMQERLLQMGHSEELISKLTPAEAQTMIDNIQLGDGKKSGPFERMQELEDKYRAKEVEAEQLRLDKEAAIRYDLKYEIKWLHTNFDEVSQYKVIGAFDIPGLGWMNDTYGHLAGDDLMRAWVAHASQYPGVTLYHVSGDEFAIGSKNIATEAEMRQMVNQIKKDMSQVILGIRGEDGSKHYFKGYEVYTGVAPDFDTAYAGIRANKAARTTPKGERPGSLIEVTEIEAGPALRGGGDLVAGGPGLPEGQRSPGHLEQVDQRRVPAHPWEEAREAAMDLPFDQWPGDLQQYRLAALQEMRDFEEAKLAGMNASYVGLLRMVVEAGGINKDLATDIAGDTKGLVPGLFTARGFKNGRYAGLGLDEMAIRMVENGFMLEPDQARAAEMIKRAIMGAGSESSREVNARIMALDDLIAGKPVANKYHRQLEQEVLANLTGGQKLSPDLLDALEQSLALHLYDPGEGLARMQEWANLIDKALVLPDSTAQLELLSKEIDTWHNAFPDESWMQEKMTPLADAYDELQAHLIRAMNQASADDFKRIGEQRMKYAERRSKTLYQVDAYKEHLVQENKLPQDQADTIMDVWEQLAEWNRDNTGEDTNSFYERTLPRMIRDGDYKSYNNDLTVDVRYYKKYLDEARLEYKESRPDMRLDAQAREDFPETERLENAGYILSDGTMLDFALYGSGMRDADHREISQIYFDENDEYRWPELGPVPDFAPGDFARKTGAIRVSLFNGHLSLDFYGVPTMDQLKVLISRQTEWEADIDFSKPDGSALVTMEINNLTAVDIANLERYARILYRGVDGDKVLEQRAQELFNHDEQFGYDIREPRGAYVGNREFQEWNRGNKLPTEPLYMGTLSELQPELRTSGPDSYFGRAIYLSSSPDDVGRNYATPEGPDREAALARKIDQIRNLYPMDQATNEELSALEAVLGKDALEMLEYEGWYEKLTRTQEEEIAKKLLEGAIMPFYVRMENPLDLTGPKHYLEYNFDEELGNESGSYVDLYNAFVNVVDDAVLVGDNPHLLWQRMELDIDGTLEDALDKIRVDERMMDLWDHNTDEPVDSGEVARRIVEQLGYDGIIMDAHKTFTGMDIEPGTKHYIVFDNKNVKSVYNAGSWRLDDANVLREPAAKYSANGPAWYDKTNRTLTDIFNKQPRMTIGQLKGMIGKTLKGDDLKWSGLDEFLASHADTDKITLDDIRANVHDLELTETWQLKMPEGERAEPHEFTEDDINTMDMDRLREEAYEKADAWMETNGYETESSARELLIERLEEEGYKDLDPDDIEGSDAADALGVESEWSRWQSAISDDDYTSAFEQHLEDGISEFIDQHQEGDTDSSGVFKWDSFYLKPTMPENMDWRHNLLVQYKPRQFEASKQINPLRDIEQQASKDMDTQFKDEMEPVKHIVMSTLHSLIENKKRELTDLANRGLVDKGKGTPLHVLEWLDYMHTDVTKDSVVETTLRHVLGNELVDRYIASIEEGDRLDRLYDRAKTTRESISSGVNVFKYTAHWDEENVLYHMRFDIRLDKQGRRVVVVQEMQSDWHQSAGKAIKNRLDQLVENQVRKHVEGGMSEKDAKKLARKEATPEQKAEADKAGYFTGGEINIDEVRASLEAKDILGQSNNAANYLRKNFDILIDNPGISNPWVTFKGFNGSVVFGSMNTLDEGSLKIFDDAYQGRMSEDRRGMAASVLTKATIEKFEEAKIKSKIEEFARLRMEYSKRMLELGKLYFDAEGWRFELDERPNGISGRRVLLRNAHGGTLQSIWLEDVQLGIKRTQAQAEQELLFSLGVEVAQRNGGTKAPKIPDAPFKKNTWALNGIKRILRWAAEKGIDKVSWVTGPQAAEVEGHGIFTEFSELKYSEELNDVAGLSRRDKSWHNQTIEEDNEIADYIGDDAAKQLMAADVDADGYHHLVTDNIVWGGERMRWFYDDVVVNQANAYLKKWGARVEDSLVVTPRDESGGSSDEFLNWRRESDPDETYDNAMHLYFLGEAIAKRDSTYLGEAYNKPLEYIARNKDSVASNLETYGETRTGSINVPGGGSWTILVRRIDKEGNWNPVAKKEFFVRDANGNRAGDKFFNTENQAVKFAMGRLTEEISIAEGLYKEFMSKPGRQDVMHTIVITDAMRESVMQGQSITEPRGAYDFLAGGRKMLDVFNDSTMEAIVRNTQDIFEETLPASLRKFVEPDFANKFMDHLQSGKDPTNIMGLYKSWLAKTYHAISTSVIQIKVLPEVKAILDQLVQEQPAAPHKGQADMFAGGGEDLPLFSKTGAPGQEEVYAPKPAGATQPGMPGLEPTIQPKRTTPGTDLGPMFKEVKEVPPIDFEQIADRKGIYGHTDEQYTQLELFARAQAIEEIHLLGKKGTVLANAMTNRFKKGGSVSIEGLRFGNAKELAVIGQVFRNPYFEVARWIFTKWDPVKRADVVVGEQTNSIRLPSSVAISNATVASAEAAYRNAGADGLWFVHNHPSGDSSASPDDLKYLAYLHLHTGMNLKGGVIINHQNFTYVNPSGPDVQSADIAYAEIERVERARTNKELEKLGDNVERMETVDGRKVQMFSRTYGLDVPTSYDLGDPSQQIMPSPLVNQGIFGPGDILGVALGMERARGIGDSALIIVSNTRGFLKGMAEIPISELRKMPRERLEAMLSNFGRQVGASKIFLANIDIRKNASLLEVLEARDLIHDAVSPDGESFVELYNKDTTRDKGWELGRTRNAMERKSERSTTLREDTPFYDPNMPPGGYDNQSGHLADEQVLDEGWAEHVNPLMDGMRQAAKEQIRQPGFSMDSLDDQTRRQLNTYLNGTVRGDLATAKLAATRHGEYTRDNALLNYSRRFGFDRYLDVIFPYQFWYTRTMMNWAKNALPRAAWFANYARMRKIQNTYKRNTPERLRNKIAIPAPYLPEWMGRELYIDPSRYIFPFSIVQQPFDQMNQQNVSQQQEAVRVLREWADSEKISQQEYFEASKGSGPTWDRALAEAQVRRKAEISSPLDMVSMTLGPAWYLTTPYYMATGQANKISPLPISRVAQGYKTAMQGTALEPLGNAIGLLAKPEQMARESAGLPENGEYGNYYIDRKLAEMTADGVITVDQAIQAMTQRSGAAFEAAKQRVNMEMMARVPGAVAIYAATHGQAGQGAAALLPSFFGAGILPEGELEFRGLKDEWDAAWAARDKGDTKAVTKFFDEHPEYSAYLMKNKPADQRLKQALVGLVWDGYMALDKNNQRLVRGQLGPTFQSAFLDKETRSYESIPVSQLVAWAKQLGKEEVIPETPETQQALAEPAELLAGLPEPVNKALNQYYKEKAEDFPNIDAVQSGYFSTPVGQRAGYRAQFPMLTDYWDFRRKFIRDNPSTRAFLDRDYAQRVINGEVEPAGMSIQTAQQLLLNWFPPEFSSPAYDATYYMEQASPILQSQLAMYAMGGQALGSGAMAELEKLWIDNGKPGGSLQGFLNQLVATAR